MRPTLNPSVIQKENVPRWLYEVLRRIESQTNSGNKELSAIARGENPVSGGQPLTVILEHGKLLKLFPYDDHPQYALLRGRTGGQTLYGSYPDTSTSAISDFSQTFVITSSRSGNVTTWSSIPIETSASVGRVVILVLATNTVDTGFSANTGGTTNFHTGMSDNQSNTYTKLREYSFQGFTGPPTDGVTVSVWYSILTASLAAGSDTLSVTFGNFAGAVTGITSRSIESRQFSMSNGVSLSVAGAADTGARDLDISSSTLSALAGSTTYLFFRGMAIHATTSSSGGPTINNTTGYTALTTNHANSSLLSDTGSRNITARGEFRVLQATGDTSDPTIPDAGTATFPDWASCFLAIQVTAPGAVGDLILQSVNQTGGSRINLHNTVINAYFDTFNFFPIGGSVVKSFIRGSDGAFVGPVSPSPLILPDSLSGSPVAGQIEFSTDDFYGTITTGAARKKFVLADASGGLTNTRVPFATINGRLLDQANFTFNGSLLTVPSISFGGLTAGRIPYVTTGSQLIDSGFLVWDDVNNRMGIGASSPQAPLHVGSAGTHTGGTTGDVLFEGRILSGNNLSGVNFTNGRGLHIQHDIGGNIGVSFARINPVIGSVTNISGTFIGLDLQATGIPGGGSGSYTFNNMRITVTTTLASSGVTCSDAIGFSLQATPIESPGIISNYTGGEINIQGTNAPKSLQDNGASTNGTTTLTVTTTTGILAGYWINPSASVTSIPAQTTVVSIDSPTTLTMSNSATGTEGPITVTFQPFATDLRGFRLRLTSRSHAMTNLVGFKFEYPATTSAMVKNVAYIWSNALIADTVQTTNWSFIKHDITAVNATNKWALDFTSTNNNRIAGKLSLGKTTAPTSWLELGAGTTTVAPLILTSGTSLTTAVAGAIEFTTDDFFATITTGTARKAFILDDGTRLTSGRVPYATTNGRLIDSSLFTFATGSGLTLSALNLITDTTTGMKIGTATNQKLSLWNAGPIVQPTAAIAAATFVANTSGIVDDSATFDGYTLGQIVKALRNFGLLA